MNDENYQSILAIAREAGDAILKIYERDDFEVVAKDDARSSPLTEADLLSHKIITQQLKKLTPNILIVSEEDSVSQQKASLPNEFWLVDPLDGTKEFIKRGGDFTVNIGLIKDKKPVAGVIFVPVTNTMYWGFGDEAWKQAGKSPAVKIHVSDSTKVKTAVASKNHFDEVTETFLKQFGEIDFTQAGSSLKLCLVAEGKAELYPRFAPTMEWDTAAGDAIIRAAGGITINPQTAKPLDYNKSGLLNPSFICCSNNVSSKIISNL